MSENSTDKKELRLQKSNNLIIMLKSILNFKGIEILSREEQISLTGGGRFDVCTKPCAMIILQDDPCWIDGCSGTPAPDPDPNPEPIIRG